MPQEKEKERAGSVDLGHYTWEETHMEPEHELLEDDFPLPKDSAIPFWGAASNL